MPMPTVGQEAPDFEAAGSDGRMVRLSSFRGRKVVLYFYPRAFTAGCTSETRQFGLLAPDLERKGVSVIGVSIDPAETQKRFSIHCKVGFPLVADPNREIARSYGVLGLIKVAKRVTFLLDEKGVILEVVESMLPGPHLARTKSAFLGG